MNIKAVCNKVDNTKCLYKNTVRPNMSLILYHNTEKIMKHGNYTESSNAPLIHDTSIIGFLYVNKLLQG